MSKESSEMYLSVNTQKGQYSPYTSQERKINTHYKKVKGSHKRFLEYIKNVYECTNPHSHMICLFYVICICVYYSLVISVNETFLFEKYYQSLSLGFLYIFDRYFFNKKDHEIRNENLTENLVAKEVQDLPGKISSSEFLIYSISIGFLSFTSELLIFYLLNITHKFGYNLSIGYSLLSFEFLMIRFYYSMQDIRIEFLNFVGLLSVFTMNLYICINYLSLPIGGVAFFISFLKFVKFLLFLDINYKYRRYTYLIISFSNLVDFMMGTGALFLTMISHNFQINIKLSNFGLIFIATIFYFVSNRNFQYFDRYCLSILSLVFPFMVVLDLLVNGRRITIGALSLVLFTTCSIGITYIGDIIWSIEDEIETIHHIDIHQHHLKENSN